MIKNNFINSYGHCIQTYTQMPTSPCKGIVYFLHGLLDHIQRYAPLAEALNKAGYGFLAFEYQGHGLSEGERGYFKNYDDLVHDAAQFIAENTQSLSNDMPRFLLGHSFGGALAFHVAIQHPSLFKGVIFSAPLIFLPANVTPFMKKMAALISKAFPKLPTREIDWQKTSHHGEAYRDDPLIVHTGLRLKPVAEMERCSQDIKANIKALTLPMLILQGTDDILGNVQGAQFLYDSAQSVDKTLKLYPGLYHELFMEAEFDVIVSEIIDWLDGHTETPAPQ